VLLSLSTDENTSVACLRVALAREIRLAAILVVGGRCGKVSSYCFLLDMIWDNDESENDRN
jgi:hypothetical protein